MAIENDLIHQFSASATELIQGESKLLLVSVGGNGATPPRLRSCSSTVPDIVAVVVESRGCWATGVRPGKTTIVALTSIGTRARIDLTVLAPAD